MSLSDGPRRANLPSVKRRGILRRKGHWSDAQKLEAVQSYLILGNLKLTSKMLSIPYGTLQVWKASEWWKTLIEELRIQDDLQVSNRLKKIIVKSYDAVEDRLENGDFVFDQKTSALRRKPVSMKEAAKVALDFSEQRQALVDRHLGEKTVTEDKIEKTLANLAEQFAKIASTVAKQDKPSMEITEVIFGKDHSNAEEKP